jgi:hypothetical protein
MYATIRTATTQAQLPEPGLGSALGLVAGAGEAGTPSQALMDEANKSGWNVRYGSEADAIARR